jgi:hypothetical protein
MASFIFRVGVLGVIFVAGLSACGSLNPKTIYADGMSTEQYRAVYEIASARCDRQTSACSSFASRDECLAAKLNVSAAETHLPRCSNDVDQAKVQSCVAEIERGQCGTGIVQLDACKKSQLCPYVSEEGTL